MSVVVVVAQTSAHRRNWIRSCRRLQLMLRSTDRTSLVKRERLCSSQNRRQRLRQTRRKFRRKYLSGERSRREFHPGHFAKTAETRIGSNSADQRGADLRARCPEEVSLSLEVE